MQCKWKFINLIFAFLLGIGVFKLLIAMSAAETVGGLRRPAVFEFFQIGAHGDPLAYLFQIIFILFFISPPLIVILLFLIWRELKNRNKLK